MDDGPIDPKCPICGAIHPPGQDPRRGDNTEPYCPDADPEGE